MSKKIAQLIAGCKKPVNQLTPSEVFTSEAFERYCRTAVSFITKQYTSPPTVHIQMGGEDVAYTTGNDIVLNVQNDIAGWYTGTGGQLMANLGILYHECAHILFLDFDKEKKAMSSVANGQFFGDTPELENCTAEQQAYLDEFVSEFESGKYTKIFTSVYANLSNIIADPHDEEKISNAFHGVIEEAIGYSTDSLWNQQKMLEDYTQEDAEKNAISIMMSLILAYARFGEIPCRYENSLEKSAFYAVMNDAMPYIDGARYTDDVVEKFSNINMVVFYLWNEIKKILKEEEKEQNQQNQQNQQGQQSQNNSSSGSSSGGSGLSKNQQEKVQQQIQQAASSVSSTAPQKRETVQKKPDAGKPDSNEKKNGNNGNNGQRHGKNDAGNKEVAKTVLETAATEAAEKKADKDAQNADLVQVSTCNQNSTHRGIAIHANRSTHRPAYCDDLIEEIKPYSKRMQKQVLEVLRDLQEGSVTKHRLYGKNFDAGDSYRPDGRFFSNKKQPMDVPDMAVSVLVDQSGSMGGTRANGATKAAVMLYDFCDGLNVPCQVAGHSAGNGVDYTIYAGFDGLAKYDIRRICAIPHNVGGCNRDGCALTISADALSKRSEQQKLLFIICDGQPNHRDYGGEEARKDIQSIVSKYRKMGVEIIACAIGDDKENIQRIYGNGFLNISDLSAMPRQLVSILKKRLTRI